MLPVSTLCILACIVRRKRIKKYGKITKKVMEKRQDDKRRFREQILFCEFARTIAIASDSLKTEIVSFLILYLPL